METFNTKPQVHDIVCKTTQSITERESKGELKHSDIMLALSGLSVKAALDLDDSQLMPLTMNILNKRINWTNFCILIHVINLISDNSGLSMHEERASIGEYLTNIIGKYSTTVPEFLNNVDDLERLHFTASRALLNFTQPHETKIVHEEVIDTELEKHIKTSEPDQQLPYKECFIPSAEESTSDAHLKSQFCSPNISGPSSLLSNSVNTFDLQNPTFYHNGHLLSTVRPFLNAFGPQDMKLNTAPVWDKNFNVSSYNY